MAFGDVVPRLGDGVVEVVPADLGEEERFFLLGDEGEDVAFDGVPALIELGDGDAGLLGEFVVVVHADVVELVPEGGPPWAREWSQLAE